MARIVVFISKRFLGIFFMPIIIQNINECTGLHVHNTIETTFLWELMMSSIAFGSDLDSWVYPDSVQIRTCYLPFHSHPPAGETSTLPASHKEFLENSPQKAIPWEKSEQNNVSTNMHTNTSAIFLVEITTNVCLKSYNNPLYYSLKYGKTAKFENFG
jgi:hypothetical protein